MAGKILIAHSSQQTGSELEAGLAEKGCEVYRSGAIADTSQLLQKCPDLLLLDTLLVKEAEPEQLANLASQLELAETFCLRLCSGDAEQGEIRRLTPFACGTIRPPDTLEQVLEQVATLLRVRHAEVARNHAQEKLLLHQMEVSEGLRSAAQIQHALLPNRVSGHTSFSFSWQFIPCETVGGDLFNVLPLSEDTLMAYMLDVSGHGVPSAMVTVSVHQSLSERTGQLVKQPCEQPPYFRITPPAEVLTALDREYPYERFEKFFTISYLLLEPETGRVRYCNGGHPPPLLVRNNGHLERLDAGGTLVGMGGLLPYEEDELTLQPGDQLYLYSDGITEHEGPAGEMFGEQRLIDYFSQQQATSLDDIANHFIEELNSFGEGKAPVDDISLLCIQYKDDS